MSGPAIGKRLLCAAVFATVALLGPAHAAEPAVYETMFKALPAPALADVQGREYKFLVDPAQLEPGMAAAFEDLWQQVVRARVHD